MGTGSPLRDGARALLGALRGARPRDTVLARDDGRRCRLEPSEVRLVVDVSGVDVTETPLEEEGGHRRYADLAPCRDGVGWLGPRISQDGEVPGAAQGRAFDGARHLVARVRRWEEELALPRGEERRAERMVGARARRPLIEARGRLPRRERRRGGGRRREERVPPRAPRPLELLRGRASCPEAVGSHLPPSFTDGAGGAELLGIARTVSRSRVASP